MQDCCIDKLNCKYKYFDYEDQTCTDSDNQCLQSCEDESLSTYCYDRTCTKYVICYYGIPVLRECRDGLQYNGETGRCDFPEYVDCVDNECSALIQPENIIFMASKANCSKYYICTDGRAWSQECSAGLVYNPEFKYCDFESNYKCPVSRQFGSVFIFLYFKPWILQTSNIVKRNITPYSRSPPRRADITCPKGGVHFYAHKKRKNAYYYCVEGNGLTLDCTPGLLYDPDVKECRDPKYINKQWAELNEVPLQSELFSIFENYDCTSLLLYGFIWIWTLYMYAYIIYIDIYRLFCVLF